MVYKKDIYLDNAAGTPVHPRVLKAMAEVLKLPGNPSSFNDSGRTVRRLLDESRKKIARFLSAHEEEVIFTSSGTESNNLAIGGLALAYSQKEIITTPIEHPSVLKPIGYLSGKGYKIHAVSVDKEGLINCNELEKKINKNTLLVSVMYANNEIGTIEPIIKISKLIKRWRSERKTAHPFFHVDACQAAGYLPMNVNQLGADLLSFNGSKIYGPKGIGVLYARRGVKLNPIIRGGGQEWSLRAGTENVAAIVGLAKAIELVEAKESGRLSGLRDYFISKIIENIPEVKINGSRQNRLPNNINFSVANGESERLLLELDKHGIRAGSGSACTAREVEPSHVLKAIGNSGKYLGGALRFTLGRQTTKKDVDYVLEQLRRVLGK